jgi:hypothetical protein
MVGTPVEISYVYYMNFFYVRNKVKEKKVPFFSKQWSSMPRHSRSYSTPYIYLLRTGELLF